MPFLGTVSETFFRKSHRLLGSRIGGVPSRKPKPRVRLLLRGFIGLGRELEIELGLGLGLG